MRIDLVTIFPEFFESPLSCSILARAQQAGLVQFALHQLRDYTEDAHRTVDDAPYGGGAGMVMKPEPFFRACEDILGGEQVPIILLTPQGQPFSQAKAQELSRLPRFVLLCGHYEGLDERVRQGLATEEISVGDYVLTGGELGALVIADAVVRLLPGAVGNEQSPAEDSFAEGLLEYPHYTRPPEFRGMTVPPTLISGHHEQIRRWRRKEALRRTLQRRPELLGRAPLTTEDHLLLREIQQETASDK